MMSLPLSLFVHVLGAVLWMSGLFAMSRALLAQAKDAGPGRPALGALAGKFHVMALLGAGLSILSGLNQLMLWGMPAFRQARWMHHKLTMVIGLLIVHVIIFTTQRKWLAAAPDATLSRGRAAGLHGMVGLFLLAILGLVFFGRLR
jgi:uncharacterized membrane protein